MNSLNICFGVVAVILYVCEAGVAKHGSQEPLTKDGKHNPHFDHEAILGSRKAEEEFEDLPPEEAKKRLLKLAKIMDTDQDKKVTKDELINKIMHSFKELDVEDALDQFKEHDTNNDSSVTWKEFKDVKYNYDESHSTEDDKTRIKREMEEDRTKFNTADLNHDNQLTVEEFLAFYLPHHYEHMHDNEINRQLQEHDKNKDGFINFEEFRGEDIGDPKYDEEKKKEFIGYDIDKNGFLNRAEMKPWSVFDDHHTATDEAEYLIKESDDDKDGVLTYDEIVDHHELFVGSQATDYGSVLHRLQDEL